MLDLTLFQDYQDSIVTGIVMTMKMSLVGIIAGSVLGLLLFASLRVGGRFLAPLYRAYITLFRGTPLLVQLFVVFYGGPHVGLDWSAEKVGLVGLTLYGAAYFAELFRAGFEAIPMGQVESARDLGLSDLQIFQTVLWPQMLARTIAPMVGQSVILVKESSVLSIITVAELTNVAMTIANQTYAMVEPYVLLALAYWGIAIAIARVGAALEARVTRYQTR